MIGEPTDNHVVIAVWQKANCIYRGATLKGALYVVGRRFRASATMTEPDDNLPPTLTEWEHRRISSILREWRELNGRRHAGDNSAMEAGERLPDTPEADGETATGDQPLGKQAQEEGKTRA